MSQGSNTEVSSGSMTQSKITNAELALIYYRNLKSDLNFTASAWEKSHK